MAEYSIAEEDDVVMTDLEEREVYNSVSDNLDGSPQPHSIVTLPLEVWAMVINYALPLVTTLHIEKASQLRIGLVSKQFRDVWSVTIYNLFHISDADNIILDDDIARRSVHFLSRFPHLKRVTFWGKDGNSLCSLKNTEWTFDIEQKRSVYSMIGTFMGAFDCGTLPHNLQIVGLSCPKKITNSTRDCRSCKKICKLFPLECIGDFDLCLPIPISKELIRSREGGRDYLYSETRLLQLLGKGRVDELHGDTAIIKYDSMVRDEFKSFIESLNVDVTKLNPEDLVKAITKRYPNNITVYLGEQSFDHLKTTIGLPISNELLDPNAIRIENLDRMVKNIMEETDSLQKSLDQMCYLLGKQDVKLDSTVLDLVVKSGVLPKVVELLQRDDNGLQLAASVILLNVAAGKSEHVEEIVKLGAIPSLVHLVGFSHNKVSESAAQALGNVAVDSLVYRDIVLQAGAMQPLLKLIEDHETSDMELVRKCVWVLSNLCEDNECHFNLVSPSIPILKKLIHTTDEEVLIDTCWALCYLTNGPDEHTKAVIDVLGSTGICRLVELFVHPSLSVQAPALKTVGNILEDEAQTQTQIIIDNGALPSLLTLLSSTDEDIMTTACGVIANISAGTEAQIQAVIDSDIIPKLVPFLNDSAMKGVLMMSDREDSNTRTEAAWVVSGIIYGGSTEQIQYLAKLGCIPPLLDIITAEDDLKIAIDVLNILESIETPGADDKDFVSVIKTLQKHANEEVRTVSTKILETPLT